MKFYFQNLLYLGLTVIFSPVLRAGIFLRKIFRGKNSCLKILIIQTTKIGDVVCTTPVFREIKKNFPASRLSVLIISRVKGILIKNPYIDEFIILDDKKYRGFLGGLRLIRDMRKKKFDWSFSMTPVLFNTILPFWALIPNRVQLRSNFVSRAAYLAAIFSNHKIDYQQNKLVLRQYLDMLKFLGVNEYSEKKDVFFDDNDTAKARNFLKENNIKENDLIIGISPTAGNKIKEWGMEKFADLSDLLIENLNAKIIFFGGLSDKPLIQKSLSQIRNNAFNASGVFNLSEVPALINFLKIFISVDTGPLYIANALGVPIVDIIGPMNVEEQLPIDEKCEIVSKKIHCFPCSHIVPTAHSCKKGHRRCVEDIKVEDVYKAVLNLKNRLCL